MKYYMKATDAEYTIEPSSSESWELKERTETASCSVGTFKTPNEAAVVLGARKVKTPERYGRRLSRRLWVLSSWQVCQQT
jgi:hypothetical protein